MAKDPAVLFYTSDFLTGTMFMSDELVGQYIKLLCIQHQRGRLSMVEINGVCNGNPDEWILSKFKIDEDGFYYNERMKIESEKRRAYVDSRRSSRTKSDEDDVRVYLVKDNVRSTYKIGSSVNPVRRYNELMNQKNPAIMHNKQGERSLTLLWYTGPVKRTFERDLHLIFKEKQITGEWFELNDDDIIKITSSTNGTYVDRTFERTYSRTENENENVNTNNNIGIAENFISKLSQDIEWVNKTAYSLGRETVWVSNMLNQRFKPHLISQKRNPPADIGEFARYFVNWARKQKDEIQTTYNDINSPPVNY